MAKVSITHIDPVKSPDPFVKRTLRTSFSVADGDYAVWANIELYGKAIGKKDTFIAKLRTAIQAVLDAEDSNAS